MAEGNTGNPKKEYPNDLSVTIPNRTSSRDKHTTPRLELDPRKKSYENKTPSEPAATTEESNSDNTSPERADPTEVVSTEETNSDTNEENINIPRMPLRKCKAAGCTYEVGQDGELPEGPEGQLRDLEVHLITCPFVIKSKKVVKDQKIPVFVSGQSFESWLQDYTLWKDNVGYTDNQYISMLTCMLKDPNTKKEVKDYFIEELHEERPEVRNSSAKIIGKLQERFGKSEAKQLEENIDKFKSFKYHGTALDSLDRLETIRGYWRDYLGAEDVAVNKEILLTRIDAIFKSMFLSEGRQENKLSDEKSLLIQNGMVSKKTWSDFRTLVKTNISEFESQTRETLYLGADNRRARSPFRKNRNDYYRSRSPSGDRRSQSQDRNNTRQYDKNNFRGQKGQQYDNRPGRSNSPGNGKRTSISEDVSKKMDPKIDELKTKLDSLETMFKQAMANQANYIQMDYMTWDHKTNPYSTLDNGSKYTLTGKPWLEVYTRKQGLTWQDLKPEPSTEYFRF